MAQKLLEDKMLCGELINTPRLHSHQIRRCVESWQGRVATMQLGAVSYIINITQPRRVIRRVMLVSSRWDTWRRAGSWARLSFKQRTSLQGKCWRPHWQQYILTFSFSGSGMHSQHLPTRHNIRHKYHFTLMTSFLWQWKDKTGTNISILALMPAPTSTQQYIFSSVELKKQTSTCRCFGLPQEMLSELFTPVETPEAPNRGFFKGLFGGGAQSLDREDLCEYKTAVWSVDHQYRVTYRIASL